MDSAANPSLRTLLDRRDLRLALISDPDALAEGALDQPTRWVHSSDLPDPTPFLADDLVLLTTGAQFSDDDVDNVRAYVARLARRGVNGLGFGSGVHRLGVPDELIAACTEHRLPLFEVPYDVPFIAIARGHAEAIAAQTYARRTWALEAQRALAIAALRPRGLESALTELSKSLGCWVGLFDASGSITHAHPTGTGPISDALNGAVAELLTRASSASRTVETPDGTHTLFTLGRTGHLRGVIAIAAAAHDAETRAVVTSVIAMAGLALEQGEGLARGRRRLHAQLLTALRADDPTIARRVLGRLPPTPMVVAVAEGAGGAFTDWWERRSVDDGHTVFFADADEGVTVCVSVADAVLVDEAAERFGIRVGVSSPGGYDTFSRAHAQAVTALRRPGPAVAARYADATGGNVLGAMATEETRLLARSRLAALHAHNEGSGADLENTLRVWLAHDARIEPAATALGVHRHTLRSRLAQAGTVLGMDLSAFPARAELWVLLQTAGD